MLKKYGGSLILILILVVSLILSCSTNGTELTSQDVRLPVRSEQVVYAINEEDTYQLSADTSITAALYLQFQLRQNDLMVFKSQVMSYTVTPTSAITVTYDYDYNIIKTGVYSEYVTGWWLVTSDSPVTDETGNEIAGKLPIKTLSFDFFPSGADTWYFNRVIRRYVYYLPRITKNTR